MGKYKNRDSRGRYLKSGIGRTAAERPHFGPKARSWFSGGTFTQDNSGKWVRNSRIISRTGWASDWAKPLSLRPPSAKRGEYLGTSARPGASKRQKWSSFMKKQPKDSKAFMLKGSREWKAQLNVAIHMLRINAERFRIVIGRRAIKVFEDSFRYQKWNSAEVSHGWARLRPATKQKRARRGVKSTKILIETGALIKSLHKLREVNGFTRISTEDVTYGGFHNVGGFRGYRYRYALPKRKFMGHSSLIHEFIVGVRDRYLFDDVFVGKHV